jgi:hypothetical protein
MLAVLLARVIVPLWLLVGAVLKLLDASPSNLPVAMVKWIGAFGVDLLFVLRFSIAVELALVGVMWLLPRLARPLGIAMLAAFVPVLLGDVLMGASSCGCFGSVQIHPGITLVVDLSFLVGLVVLGGRAPSLAWSASQPSSRVLAAGLWTVVSFAVGFGLTNPGSDAQADATPAGVAEAVTAPLPAEGYHMPQYESWLGRQFTELPIAAWIQGMPEDIGVGRQYVMFYRKDCEHCHELMEAYFSGELPLPTTAVAVPERAGFPTNAFAFPCAECRTARLPSGVDWFLQTPVLVSLADGAVVCAAEVSPDDPLCLER